MKISAGSIRSYYVLLLSGTLLLIDVVIGSPVPTRNEKEMMLLPMQVPSTRFVQVPVPINSAPSYYYQPYPYAQQGSSNTQIRGPFDFIGQWVQQTPWLPLQINVPDVFQNIGNGISQAQSNIGQFTQSVGNGVSQWGQNVGNGFNQFTQNVGNGFQNWMQQLGQRVPIIGNIVGGNKIPILTTNNKNQQVVMMVPIEYPGGQQLVLGNEAMEAFP